MSYPTISGGVGIQVQDDRIFSSDNSDEKSNRLFTKIEPYFTLSFTERLALEGGFVFKPVKDPYLGRHSHFHAQGLFAEELKMTYTTDDFGLYAGKYNPNFGAAFEQGPSIYGNDFASDYELTERIGVGGFVPFETSDLGGYTLSANLFFADTTFLSKSVFTGRGNVSLNDGGVSNTQSLSSYSLELDSEDFLGITNLSSRIAYRHQKAGDADVGLDDENGYLIGADYSTALNDNLDWHAMFEAAMIDNVDGSPDRVHYVTLATDVTYLEHWTLAGSYSGRHFDMSNDTNLQDYLYDVTAGYHFDNGIGVNVAYTKAKEDRIARQGVGLLLTYDYEF